MGKKIALTKRVIPFEVPSSLRKQAKAIRFAALYGASVEKLSDILGTYTKETRDMKSKKMIKHRGRIRLKPEQVFHFGKSGSANYACFVCGAPAMHQVRAVNDGSTGYKQGDLYLCTQHFVQIFSLPPNRHTKKSVIKSLPPPPIDQYGNMEIKLRRFMNVPYFFTGKRVFCHQAKIAGTIWYFSLYRTVESDFILTTTRVSENRRGKMAINLVELGLKNPMLLAVPVEKQLRAMDEFVPFEREALNEHIRVQEAATDFIDGAYIKFCV